MSSRSDPIDVSGDADDSGVTAADRQTASDASVSASSEPALVDHLAQSFSGETLSDLSHLGVAAFPTSDVEQSVISRALAASSTTSTTAPATNRNRLPLNAKRKRIPRKNEESVAATSAISSAPFLGLSHPDDTRGRPPHAPKPQRRPSAGVDADTDTATNSARQAMIDSGQVTPFDGLTGSTTYRRVAAPTKKETLAPPRARSVRTSTPPPPRASRSREPLARKPPRLTSSSQPRNSAVDSAPSAVNDDDASIALALQLAEEENSIGSRAKLRRRAAAPVSLAADIEDDDDDDEPPARRRPYNKFRPDEHGDGDAEYVDRSDALVGDEESSDEEKESIKDELSDDMDDDEDVIDVQADDNDDDDVDGGIVRSRGRSSRGSFVRDDYDDDDYQQRISSEEAQLLTSTESLDVAFDGGFVVPGRIWDGLYEYQRTALKWLWELHCQNAGGIIADEMGLGKTVVAVSYVASLHYSIAVARQNGTNLPRTLVLPPSIILCPATIMTQWMREFHKWAPQLRIILLHDSVDHGGHSKSQIVDKLANSADVLITTYEGARLEKDLLLNREWGYVILDEGHKIRNPNAAITLVAKQFLSIHRIILSGAPIQNNLIELWSLFDFVFPGKLGTLPVFEEEFVYPINVGGYTSATTVQVQLAYKCAMILRDLIHPYILRRSKADVAQHLPKKNEQVLFCNLAPFQVSKYKQFLSSSAVNEVINGRGSLFRAIHILRKLCNHPDLIQLQTSESGRKVEPDHMEDYGAVERSGKLMVVRSILRMWHQEEHRVLLFTQTRQMLDIIETFMKSESYTYLRIDGNTSIRTRLPLIDEFNRDTNIYCFLLTTRAGGLGINLTGADRVILYDPDWNPSTDLQARERAYRIGQQRNVTVYRLLTRGTIEEKVYHRQIFKQFLTDKILKDPKQKRFFSRRDIKDLFVFDESGRTETGNIFGHISKEIQQADMKDEHDTADGGNRSRRGGSAFKRESDAESISAAEDGEVADYDDLPTNKRARGVTTVKREDAPAMSAIADVAYSVDEDKNDMSTNSKSASDSSENRILSALFSAGGIQSAMNHDLILGSSDRQDKLIAESVARKVAENAVAALKRSINQLSSQPINVPTWTGRQGLAGNPAHKPRFGTVSRHVGHSSNDESVRGGVNALSGGLSSSQLLSTLKNKQYVNTSTVSGLPDAKAIDVDYSNQNQLNSNTQRLLSDMYTFLAARPNGVSSEAMVSAFARQMSTDSDKYVFRQLLKLIAKLEKMPNGKGIWKLKADL